ncbi:MAG: hypothetical protein Q9195_009519 [Heterodermia aff. obscurata]
MPRSEQQRANILLSTFVDHDEVLNPEQVSAEERIFEWDGALRWKGSTPFAKARIGVSLRTLLSSMAPPHAATGSTSDANWRLTKLFKLFAGEQYLLWYDVRCQVAYIVLKSEAKAPDSLKAWTQALVVAYRLHVNHQYATGARDDWIFEILETTLVDLSKQWEHLIDRLVTAGWDVDVSNLETVSGTRIQSTQIVTATSTQGT